VIKFILSEDANIPSEHILQDIGRRLTEEKGQSNGIYFYAEKSESIYNLFAFSNNIPSIENFKSNKLRGVLIPIRVQFSGTTFYLMTRSRKLQKLKNFTRLVHKDETYVDAVRRNLQDLQIANYSITRIGTNKHINYPFLDGKWILDSEVIVVNTNLTHVNQLNSLIGSNSNIFIEKNQYEIPITKFSRSEDLKNDDQSRELLRQESTISNDANDEFYGRDSIFVGSREFLDYHLDIIKFLDGNSNIFNQNYVHDHDTNHKIELSLSKLN
jgi:hypothetical protein